MHQHRELQGVLDQTAAKATPRGAGFNRNTGLYDFGPGRERMMILERDHNFRLDTAVVTVQANPNDLAAQQAQGGSLRCRGNGSGRAADQLMNRG